MLRKATVFFLPIILISAIEEDSEECNTRELTQSYITVPSKISGWSGSSSILDMYLSNGFDYHTAHMFMDVYLQINLTNELTYQLYQGENCSEVLQHYRDDQRLWGLVRRVKLLRCKQLNPFQKTVIGVSTQFPYEIRIRVWKINYMRLVVFLGGITLFLMSHKLVRNALFYYTSGCTIGILASFLIVGFIVYRLTPKGWMGIPLIFSSWSFSFYIIYIIWKNFASLVLQYQKFVAAYFATVILVSLAICYRYGPPTDVRSHNLAQWALQLIAMILIYSSCQITDIAVGVIVLLLLWSVSEKWLISITLKFIQLFKAFRNFLFPQCQRLLTMDEYQQQGEEETRKALEQLRMYCRSPEANAWKITSLVKNPKRLASFVDGASDHITEDESRLYDLESTNFEDFSDSSEDDEHIDTNRSGLNYSYEPLKRYEARSSISTMYSKSANCNFNLERRQTHNVRKDMSFNADDEDGDDELLCNWKTHSFPSRSSQRQGFCHEYDLHHNGTGMNSPLSSFRYRGKTLSQSPPRPYTDPDAEEFRNFQNR